MRKSSWHIFCTDNVSINNFIQRIKDSIRGNFPGAEWDNNIDTGTIPPLKKEKPYSIATTSNAPTEKSEKLISQTIEKLLDGIVSDSLIIDLMKSMGLHFNLKMNPLKT